MRTPAPARAPSRTNTTRTGTRRRPGDRPDPGHPPMTRPPVAPDHFRGTTGVAFRRRTGGYGDRLRSDAAGRPRSDAAGRQIRRRGAARSDAAGCSDPGTRGVRTQPVARRTTRRARYLRRITSSILARSDFPAHQGRSQVLPDSRDRQAPTVLMPWTPSSSNRCGSPTGAPADRTVAGVCSRIGARYRIDPRW